MPFNGRHPNGRMEAHLQTVFYARCSTADQTIAHQEKQARDAGFAIDRVVADHGVSGITTRLAERPEGKRLFDILRAGDLLVCRWVDRLGRNYEDVTSTIRELMGRGIVIKTIINRMTFDGATTDPIQQAVRDALIAFMAASAQAQAEATKVAMRAGIDFARANNENAYRGRKPSYTRTQMESVRNMLAQDAGISVIAKASGLSRQAIYRIRDEPAEAEAALRKWGL